MEQDWQLFALSIAAFLVSLSVHEAAHAWTAWRLGDWTGKNLGRVSLNPIRHIDPFGTLLLPAVLWFATKGQVVFGYAKPVPYNPYVLRNPSLGSAAIAGAGPASNFLLAAAAAALYGLALRFAPAEAGLGRMGALPSLGHLFLLQLVVVNIWLALFNLLPLPPLDGGTVVAGLLGRRVQAAMARFEQYAFIVLILLMSTKALDRILWPLYSGAMDIAFGIARTFHG